MIMQPMNKGLSRAAGPWVITDSASPPPEVLTSGSDLNKAATGPWAPLSDAGQKVDRAWTPNVLQAQYTQSVPANYGSLTSTARYATQYYEYSPANDRVESVGLLPGPIPNAHRPMWNNMPRALYRQRVANPTAVPNMGARTVMPQTKAVQFTPNQTATTGNAYKEVLL